MGKILIIRGARYTPPTSTPEDENPGNSQGGNSQGSNNQGGNQGGNQDTNQGDNQVGNNSNQITLTNTTGSYLNTNGVATPLNDYWHITDYIEVPSNATAIQGTMNIYKRNGQNISIAICFYNSSKTFISGCNELESQAGTLTAPEDPSSHEYWGTILALIPQGTAYMRVCWGDKNAIPADYITPTLRFVLN